MTDPLSPALQAEALRIAASAYDKIVEPWVWLAPGTPTRTAFIAVAEKSLAHGLSVQAARVAELERERDDLRQSNKLLGKQNLNLIAQRDSIEHERGKLPGHIIALETEIKEANAAHLRARDRWLEQNALLQNNFDSTKHSEEKGWRYARQMEEEVKTLTAQLASRPTPDQLAEARREGAREGLTSLANLWRNGLCDVAGAGPYPGHDSCDILNFADKLYPIPAPVPPRVTPENVTIRVRRESEMLLTDDGYKSFGFDVVTITKQAAQRIIALAAPSSTGADK